MVVHREEIIELRIEGLTIEQISERTGNAQSTIQKTLKDAGLTKQGRPKIQVSDNVGRWRLACGWLQ